MFCPNCGNEIREGSIFCGKCGNKISSGNKNGNSVASVDDTVELVNRAKAGDESAFHQLYDRTSKRNYYVALKMVKTDADAQDVLQDAYIRIYQHLDQFQYQGEGSFASWSSKIVSNTALNHLRKKQMVLFSDIEGDQEGEFSLEIEDEDTSRQPELAYDKKETSKIVQDLLGTLSDEQRVCAMMFYFQEESVKDIASEIGCSENTVKSRLNYARKNMMAKAEELKKKGILTGILSIAGLFAILRSNEAMAMEHVPSGVYSAVSGSINWESMAAYASNSGSVVASGSNVSGSAVSGGTVATGTASTAGAVASTGMGIKIVIAVIAAVVVLGGGIAAVLIATNNSESPVVETQVENTSENQTVSPVSSPTSTVEPTEEPEDEVDEEHIKEVYKEYLSNLPRKVVTYVMCGYGWGEDVDGVDPWAQNRVEDASESDIDNRILYDKDLFEKTGRVSDVKTVLTRLLNRYCIVDIDEDGIPELILV